MIKRVAIIGGTGVYGINSNEIILNIKTIYGQVEVNIIKLNNDKEIVFLPRHGKGHSTPPHLINYRANMMALKELSVTHIYSTCAVGSLNENYDIGDIVIINDFLDFTKNRINTFFDGDDGVKHTDMSDPYCSYLRNKVMKFSSDYDINIKGNAVYACTEGPRFETSAEIKMYGFMGADVVGMTNVPEVVLAKELGMCYSAIGIITNWCTGFKKGEDIVLHEIASSIEKNKIKLEKMFIEILSGDLSQDECNCNNAILEL
ncbi:S-methyl-5'-thioinosine phosphorylase [Helicovermis profundi]|uniref:Purine nucleoside phosphorylase n=1 Tax=Helicovermis profundi TaxID=3065157 RepID=A0AAU9E535_9FIRM|nr:S-methyl-5'-thioadenosine phosphorylase [Clostridia bacterium S502]